MANKSVENIFLGYYSGVVRGYGFHTKPADAKTIIFLVAYSPLILLGLVGNSLSFIVMNSKQMRKQSFSIYLASIAIFDTTCVFFRLAMCLSLFYKIITKTILGVFRPAYSVTVPIVEYF